MPAYFFDTSALVKQYHVEEGTDNAEAIFQQSENRLIVAMTEVHFSLARTLILDYGSLSSLRTLDALQLAVAFELHRQKVIDLIVSSDVTFTGVAHALQLPVQNALAK